MQDLEDILKGKWFYTLNDTEEDPCYSGKVVQFFPPNYVLVRLQSFVGGFSEGQKVLEITKDFSFFRTQTEMEAAFAPKLGNYYQKVANKV